MIISLKKMYPIIILISSILLSGIVRAEPVRLVSPFLGDQLHLSDGSGLYGDILSRTYLEAGISPNVKILPFKRTVETFFDEKADCIWPIDKFILNKLGYKTDNLIESETMFHTSQHVFVAAGQPAISSLSQLNGKRVGILNGSSVEKRLTEVSAEIISVPDQKSKIQMFLNNRLDAFIGWYPDIYVILKQLDQKPDILPSDLLIIKSSAVNIVCRNSSNTTAYLNILNPVIQRLKNSGIYNQILWEYGVPRNPSN